MIFDELDFATLSLRRHRIPLQFFQTLPSLCRQQDALVHRFAKIDHWIDQTQCLKQLISLVSSADRRLGAFPRLPARATRTIGTRAIHKRL